MKPDAKVREDVIRRLQWDAQVPDPDAIGVAVKDGAVTLTRARDEVRPEAGGGPCCRAGTRGQNGRQ